MEDLSKVLEKDSISFKISTSDDKVQVSEMKIENASNFVEKKENKELTYVEGGKESKFVKIITSVGRVFEEFIDSFAKKFLKEKFKLNYSVYNDGKKAFVAVKNKDSKTFWKKATDSLLYIFKKIPSETKKVIKNTKNVAIDEIFSWKKE